MPRFYGGPYRIIVAVSHLRTPSLKRGQNPTSGTIRIIVGKWRSRRLRFPAAPQLRPSPDAVRETLFNWLQFDLPDSRCLDLFAGSGALGFEAASRGARSVTMVEANPKVARQLEANTQILDAGDIIQVKNAKADEFLGDADGSFDIIFMDPPFSTDDLNVTCHLLSETGAMMADTLV